MPEILDACARSSGCLFESFSTISFESPDIFEKSIPLGIFIFERCFVFSISFKCRCIYPSYFTSV